MTQRGIPAGETLYEAVVVAVSQAIASGAEPGQARGEELGRWILRYLGTHGFPLGDESGRLEDLLARFVDAGFASGVEVSPGAHGTRCFWHGLRGAAAWETLRHAGVSPFLASPAGLALRYLASRRGQRVRVHRESLDAAAGTAEVELELVAAEEAPAPAREQPEGGARRLELRGLVSICAGCKKIRVPGGWEPVEAYLAAHSCALFSHGICPECMERLYPANGDSRG